MDYCIGGHNIRVTVEGAESLLDTLLPSFVPFKIPLAEGADMLFTLRLEQHLRELPASELRLITEADTGNGKTRVERTADGRYQFLIHNTQGMACALLIATPQFDDCRCAIRGDMAVRHFAINSVLMLVYAFSAAFRETLLVHASVVRHAGRAYAFTAESGTGKSTQVANWLMNIEGCDLINDDNPIIRLVDGFPTLYGSPWSGKTACYRNVSVPLGAVLKIERDTRNHVEPLSPVSAFAVLLTACSAIRSDEEIYHRLCDTVSALVGKVTMATLHCLPDAASARVCQRFLEG